MSYNIPRIFVTFILSGADYKGFVDHIHFIFWKKIKKVIYEKLTVANGVGRALYAGSQLAISMQNFVTYCLWNVLRSKYVT